MENILINTDRYTIKLVTQELDVNDAISSVKSSQCGAISIFMGTTRDTETGECSDKLLSHLYYEAYDRMAIKQMKSIVEQTVMANSSAYKCYLAHRLGCVGVGDASILIACSAPHRTQAHQTVINILNEVKAKVPIWKKIYYITSDDNCSDEWSDKSEAFWMKKS